jgi:ParB-like chromosome segregation protein Spo0J
VPGDRDEEGPGGRAGPGVHATRELRTYQRNPRQCDPTAIARSLAVNGQYRPIVVNKGTYTGRPNEVLAGNHTLIAARDLGWEHIAVVPSWVSR